MTEPLQEDPEFVRLCILYEILDGKSVQEAYESFCKVMGAGIIRFVDFESWYTRFHNEVQILEGKRRGLYEIPKFLRSCVLYKAVERKEVIEAFKNFCKTLGDDAMEYLDFDYWFYQFYHGNYDLVSEKLAPRIHLLLELPSDILGKIIKNVDLMDHLMLRKVSLNFRRFIDNQKPSYNNISIFCESYNIQMNFDGHDVIYTDFSTCEKLLKEEDEYRAVRAKNWRQAAFDDVAIALRHPKLHLEYFKIEYRTASGSRPEHDSGEKTANWMYKKLRTLFKSLKHKISVKNATLYAENEEQFLMVLPYLKPEVLEKIDLSDAGYPCEKEHKPDMMNIDKLIKLDQWKHAKEICARYLLTSLSVDNFSHCNSFAIYLNEITLEDLARLRNTILKSDDLKYYHIKTERKLKIDNVTKGDLSNANGFKLRHYPVPDTNKILKLDISSNRNFTIRTEKKTCVGSL